MNHHHKPKFKKSLTPAYLRLVTDTVYGIQRIVISSTIPENFKDALIQEMESAVEACKRLLPEKQFTLIITDIPSLIRRYIQMFADEIGLSISISDESRKHCARILLEKKLAEEIALSPNKQETFLQILWRHFNLKDFRSDTNHITTYLRGHLREEYRLKFDEHKIRCAFLTRPEYVWVIDKIRAEIKRLEIIVVLHKTVNELKFKPEYENISEILNRIIKLMSYLWKHKCCKNTLCEPLYYMREAVLYSGINVILTLKHALFLLKKSIQGHKISDLDKSSAELKTIFSSDESSHSLSYDSSYMNLLDRLKSEISIYHTESINQCKIVSSISKFS